MNLIHTFLFYNLSFRAHPRYYSEKEGAPQMINTFLDMGVQKVTKGKKGFVGVRNYEHDCPVCLVHFWSDRKEEKSCGRWKCFREAWSKV